MKTIFDCGDSQGRSSSKIGAHRWDADSLSPSLSLARGFPRESANSVDLFESKLRGLRQFTIVSLMLLMSENTIGFINHLRAAPRP